MSEDEHDYGLVMPFVVTTSVGGPHDDDDFAAGWACGAIDALLAQHPAEVGQTVRTSIVPQLDLIAMRHGFVMETEPTDFDEWTIATWRDPNPRVGSQVQDNGGSET